MWTIELTRTLTRAAISEAGSPTARSKKRASAKAEARSFKKLEGTKAREMIKKGLCHFLLLSYNIRQQMKPLWYDKHASGFPCSCSRVHAAVFPAFGIVCCLSCACRWIPEGSAAAVCGDVANYCIRCSLGISLVICLSVRTRACERDSETNDPW